MRSRSRLVNGVKCIEMPSYSLGDSAFPCVERSVVVTAVEAAFTDFSLGAAEFITVAHPLHSA